MTNLIEACQSIDIKLAQTIGPQIKPILFLEDIRTGSPTTFLRSVLESFDDDGIKNLEWKKLVGSYFTAVQLSELTAGSGLSRSPPARG